MEGMYRCSMCGVEKPLSEFHVDRSKKNGHKSHCKSCVKNTPGRAEYMRQYSSEHRDYYRDKHAEYRERNREKLRLDAYNRYHSEAGRAYREATQEHMCEKNRSYYEANRERAAERSRAYRKSEHGQAQHLFDKTRRRASVFEGDRDITLRAVFDLASGQCALCGGVCDYNDYVVRDGVTIVGNAYPSIDHIIPLSLGGTHTWDNVQLAHKRCNSAKKDKINFDRKEASGYGGTEATDGSYSR